jgi:hypothetical protein
VRRGVRGKNTPRRPNVKTRCDFTHTEGVVGDIDMTLKCQFLRFRFPRGSLFLGYAFVQSGEAAATMALLHAARPHELPNSKYLP